MWSTGSDADDGRVVKRTDATAGGAGPKCRLELILRGACRREGEATCVNRGNADGSARRSANRRAALAAPCGDDGDAASGRGGDGTGRTTSVRCTATAGGGETTRTRDTEVGAEGARKLTN